MIGRAIGRGFAGARDFLARALIKLGVTPNALTLGGMLLTIGAGVCYGLGAGAPFDKGPVYKAPVTMPYDWTGCYVGAQAGGGVLGDSFAFNLNGGGGILGGQIGCNVQRGQVVFGFEGEAARSGLKRVLMPARNRKDYEDIPEDARARLEFTWLERVEDAVAAALEERPPAG